MRIPYILLALGLVAISAGVPLASARADRCPEENIKKFFKRFDECPREYVERVTALTNGKPLYAKATAAADLRLAKHAGGYYLVLCTANRPYKSDFKVRAEQDALMFKFDDDTVLELYVEKDTSSGQRKAWERFCGFYSITQEQLESVRAKTVAEVVQFIVPVGKKVGRRVEQTEDGRTFYHLPVKLDKNRRELADQAECVLKFDD